MKMKRVNNFVVVVFEAEFVIPKICGVNSQLSQVINPRVEIRD